MILASCDKCTTWHTAPSDARHRVTHGTQWHILHSRKTIYFLLHWYYFHYSFSQLYQQLLIMLHLIIINRECNLFNIIYDSTSKYVTGAHGNMLQVLMTIYSRCSWQYVTCAQAKYYRFSWQYIPGAHGNMLQVLMAICYRCSWQHVTGVHGNMLQVLMSISRRCPGQYAAGVQVNMSQVPRSTFSRCPGQYVAGAQVNMSQVPRSICRRCQVNMLQVPR